MAFPDLGFLPETGVDLRLRLSTLVNICGDLRGSDGTEPEHASPRPRRSIRPCPAAHGLGTGFPGDP